MKHLILLLFAGIGFFHFGFGQWNTDPMINTAIATAPGEEAIPKVAVAESGITYISWFSNESGNYNIRLQKFDVYGNKLWAEGGLLISDNPSMTWLTDWDMTVDQEENAILVLQDIRTGYNDVFAYRISPDGTFVWGDDGLQLSTGEAFDAAPKVTVSNAGNSFFAWQADDVIIGQKISPEGTLLWGPNGLTMSGANTFSWPQLLPVGDDDFIMKFFEDSGPVWAPTRHVFAQRFDGTGNPVWAQPAVISDAGGISAWTQIFPFINDGNDGFYIAWHDDRDNNMLANMWVQHIGSDGSVLFAADGVEVSTMAARNHFYAHLALPEGSDDIFIYWNEMDGDQNLRGIYGQKVSSTGERLWTNNGKTFIEISALNVYPLAARNTDTGMVVFYEEYFNSMDGKIKAMRIATDGSYVWDPNMIDMCTVQSAKVHTEVSNLNNGQWIAVWEDDRSGTADIYGQNIQLDGTLGPITISYSLTLSLDTMFFYVGGSETQYLTVYNNNPVDLSIQEIFIDYDWIFLQTFLSYPYLLASGDSVELEIWIFDGSDLPVFNFDYHHINVITETDTTTCTVALEEGFVGTEANNKFTEYFTVYPNPFNSQQNFEFNCGKEAKAELTILNAQGNTLMTSVNISCSPGTNFYQWDGKTNSGITVPGGIYFYTLTMGDKVITGRIVKTN